MIIAINSKEVINLPGIPIECSPEDIAISSLALLREGAALRRFIELYTIEITKETLAEVQREKSHLVKESHPSYISYKDEMFILFVESFSWDTIVLIWSLHVTLDKRKTYELMRDYIEATRLKLYNHKKMLENIHLKIRHADKINQAPYFNARKFVVECKKLKIAVKIVDTKIGLSFNNVALGNAEEGTIRYDRILLVLDGEGMIDGFFLYFKDFMYSSYWNLPGIILHPYLSPGYAFNSSLSWLDKNDAAEYAKGIVDTVLNYHPNSGIKHVNQIVRDFQELRKYWAGLKSVETDDLSRTIFTEFSKSLNIPEIISDEEEPTCF